MGLIRRVLENWARSVGGSVVSQTVPSWLTSYPLASKQPIRELLEQGYRREALIYSCINEIASSAAEPELKAGYMQPDGEVKEDPNHPLRTLFRNPNPDTSSYGLINRLLIDLEATGGYFLQKVKNRSGNTVQLWNVRPDRIRFNVNVDGGIDSYQYSFDGTNPRNIPAAEIIYDKFPDPLDDFWGLSPITALARFGDLDRQTADFMRSYFHNAGSPAGILKFKAKVQKEERERIKQLWQAQYTGIQGANGMAVLDADADYQSLGGQAERLRLNFIFDATETRICCKPGTQVVTQRGLIPIESVEIGDMVMTHKGRWRKVITTMRRPAPDDVTEIKANGLDPLVITGNHRVWAATYAQNRQHLSAYQSTDWKEARDLKPKRNRGGFDALTVPQLEIQNSDYPASLGFLLGLFLAEGSRHKSDPRRVTLAFGDDEPDLHARAVEAVKDALGVTALVRKAATSTTVTFSHAGVPYLFDCGGTARHKRVPAWAWTGSEAFLAAMLEGWGAGDGCRQKNGERKIATTSRDLAWHMRLVATTCGYESSVSRAYQNPGGVIDGRQIHSRGPIYILRWREGKTKRRGTYRLDGGALTSPIRSVTPYPLTGDVFNLEIEEDHSYLTTGGTVSNCMCFGVPPILVGAAIGLNRSTFANYAEARRSFWDETLSPLYKQISQALMRGFVDEYGPNLVIWFDTTNVSALQEDHEQLRRFGLDAWNAMLITRNEAREMAGLPPAANDVDGDEFKSEPVQPSVLMGQGDPLAGMLGDGTRSGGLAGLLGFAKRLEAHEAKGDREQLGVVIAELQHFLKAHLEAPAQSRIELALDVKTDAGEGLERMAEGMGHLAHAILEQKPADVKVEVAAPTVTFQAPASQAKLVKVQRGADGKMQSATVEDQ